MSKLLDRTHSADDSWYLEAFRHLAILRSLRKIDPAISSPVCLISIIVYGVRIYAMSWVKLEGLGSNFRQLIAICARSLPLFPLSPLLSLPSG
jgi:hypothetical protein